MEATTWDYQPGSFTPIVQSNRSWLATAPQTEIDRRFHTIVCDLVGSPTHLVDPDGDIAWHTHPTVWGTTVAPSPGTVDCPLRFPGQYHDPETGHHYNNQRHYDPETGRYLSQDPLGLDAGPSPVAYPGNPVMWSDPLGLACGEGRPIRLKAGQQARGGAYKLAPAKMRFVRDLLDMKPNFWVYRTHGKMSQGDFLVVDYSNRAFRVGWVVELKSAHGGFPGEQFMNAQQLKIDFDLDELEFAAGTPAEMLGTLNRGRRSWNR